MIRHTIVDRYGLVVNVLAAAAAAYFLARGASGVRLGPARTDDLPYGDLITLDRNGALLWLIAGLVGVCNAFFAHRALRALAAAGWLALAAIGATVVIAGGDTLGMKRPGGIAVCLGLGIAALSSPKA